MSLDKLNLTDKQKELVKLLLSKETVQEIVQKLLGDSVHELVQKPRLHFEHTPKSRRKLLQILKNKDYEEDFGEEYEEELTFQNLFPKPLDKYFRRDTFLSGGAVAAIIFEKLTGTKAVINDIDLFFYHYSGKDQASAEQERYNNLSGEERAYHIRQVKEVGILNLIQINLEDNFSWWSVLDSFDLNYSQVGINLSENQIYFTKNFIDFLEKKVIELVPDFDKEFPLTSYLRGVHKAQDFQVPFYVRDLMQKYIANNLGGVIFGEKETTLTVRTNEDDHDGDEFVTEKRLQHWIKNPDMLPFMKPEEYNGPQSKSESKYKKKQITHQIKIQLPDEPWVGVVETIYQVYNRENKNDVSSNVMVSQLQEIIPNFYNLRPRTALRLKQFMQTKLFSSKVDYRKNKTDLVEVLKSYPGILTKDLSIKKVTQVETFFHSHLDFLQKMNYKLLQRGHSINDLFDFLSAISKFDLAIVGILETTLVDNNNEYQRSDLSNDQLMIFLERKMYKELEDYVTEIYKRRLEKNRVVSEEQKLKIKPFSRWVTELVQNDQLILEGKNMNHCVGGYGEKVKRNESRIFHIQVGKNSSTLEVGVYIKKIVPKSEKQILKPNEFKEISVIQKADPVDKEKIGYVYSLRVENRRDNTSKFYFKPMANPKEQKNFFTDKYTVCFRVLQHRAKYNGNPHKSNKKVEELLLKYLNSEIPRNQKWLKDIILSHITKDNKVHGWPYLKLED